MTWQVAAAGYICTRTSQQLIFGHFSTSKRLFIDTSNGRSWYTIILYTKLRDLRTQTPPKDSGSGCLMSLMSPSHSGPFRSRTAQDHHPEGKQRREPPHSREVPIGVTERHFEKIPLYRISGSIYIYMYITLYGTHVSSQTALFPKKMVSSLDSWGRT